MRTLHNNTLAVLALASDARTDGDDAGATIDLSVYGNDFRDVEFVVTTATITDGTHAVTIEHSDNGTDWTAAPDSRVIGSLPSIVAANDNAVFQFGYKVGTEQYVRISVETSDSETGGVFSAVALLASGSNRPPARA